MITRTLLALLLLTSSAFAGSPYTSLVGPLPHPHSAAILGYAPKYIRARCVECPIERTTTYYIEYDAAGNSTGGSGDGSSGNPWKCATLSDLKTLIEAQASADEAFLLERGSVWRGNSAGPVLDVDDVTIGAYGTGAMPELRRTESVTAGWTLATGTKYSRTWATAVAWILDPTDYITLPLARQTSAGDVPTTITGTGGTFHWVANTLTVDIGESLASKTLEIIHDNSDTGIMVNSDGCRVDSIMLVGFGLNTTTPANQNHAVRFSGTGTETFVCSNCRAYYGSTHLLAQYTATSGGFSTWISNEYGWSVPSTASTLLNGYAADGEHEFVTAWNHCIGGELPAGTAPGKGEGNAIYGHTNATTDADLYFAHKNTMVNEDDTPFYPHLLVFGDPVEAGYDLADYRAFWVGMDFGSFYIWFNEPNNCYINCTSSATPTGSGTSVAYHAHDDRAYLINHRYYFTFTSSNFSSVTNWHISSTASNHDAHRDHCGIYYTGNLTSLPVIRWDLRVAFNSEEDPRLHRLCLMANLMPSTNVVASWGNESTINQGCAYYRIASSTDAVAGYDQDTNDLTLGSPVRYGQIPYAGDQLTKTGLSSIGLEYDCLENIRDPDHVTAGPYAVPTIPYAARPRVGVVQ